MDGHEWYYLVGGNTRPLATGNMFSNEPGIYIVGEFGIRTEDEMLITDDGARLLLPQAKKPAGYFRIRNRKVLPVPYVIAQFFPDLTFQ